MKLGHPNFEANKPIRGAVEGPCRECGEIKPYEAGRGYCCRDCNNKLSREFYFANKHRPEIIEGRRERARSYAQRIGTQKKRTRRQKFKEQLVETMGGGCACCGETEILFLAIDHVNNDGNEHRKVIGANIYDWLHSLWPDIPEGFQILCHNCNWGKHVNKGICPHQGGDSDKK